MAFGAYNIRTEDCMWRARRCTKVQSKHSSISHSSFSVNPILEYESLIESWTRVLSFWDSRICSSYRAPLKSARIREIDKLPRLD